MLRQLDQPSEKNGTLLEFRQRNNQIDSFLPMNMQLGNKSRNTSQEQLCKREDTNEKGITHSSNTSLTDSTSSSNSGASGKRNNVDDTNFSIQEKEEKSLSPDDIPPICSETDEHVAGKLVNQGSQCMVIAKRQQPASLPEALILWMESAEKLARSSEMAIFLQSTSYVAASTASIAFRTATLPVRIPLKVCVSATSFAIGVSTKVIGKTGSMVERLIIGRSSTGESTESPSADDPVTVLIRGALAVPGTVVGIAGKIKEELSSSIVSVLAPEKEAENKDEQDLRANVATFPNEADDIPESPPLYATASGQSSSEANSDDFLERLRLDTFPSENSKAKTEEASQIMEASVSSTMHEKQIEPMPRIPINQEAQHIETKSRSTLASATNESSKFLLRIDDLQLYSDDGKLIYHIDLTKEHMNKELLNDALRRLVFNALSMLANHPPARLSSKQYTTTDITEVHWKPEGSTRDKLRKMSTMSKLERLKIMSKETLIWSGNFKMQEGTGRNFSLFLARSFIPLSPREFSNLLWDDSRAGEYNNFSMGRKTAIPVDDNVLNGASTGIKAVKSETRVPLTRFCVATTCLMYVKPLEAPDSGFVVVSRSLDCGVAGTHVGNRDKVEQGSNQILWGVNILRSVPNHPHLTDLISINQMDSSKIPGFMAHRIAIMGIEDFFERVRKIGTELQKKQSGYHHATTC